MIRRTIPTLEAMAADLALTWADVLPDYLEELRRLADGTADAAALDWRGWVAFAEDALLLAGLLCPNEHDQTTLIRTADAVTRLPGGSRGTAYTTKG